MSGDRKTKRRSNAPTASPANRSSRLAGPFSVANGGMKRAPVACQNGVFSLEEWTTQAPCHIRMKKVIQLIQDRIDQARDKQC